MKITIGMFTAREDYSIIGYPNIHIFEYLMKSLREQTYKKFDVVIADVLYESRKDYFKNHPENFEVKHVPIKPNVWISKGYYAISTCRNTCILHAKGDAVFLIGDCTAIEPVTLEKTVIQFYEGADYVYTAYEARLGDKFISYGIAPDSQIGLGYCGLIIPLKWAELVNGYDEIFDGSRGYEDGDMTFRLFKMGAKIGFNRCLMTHQQHSGPKIIKKVLRCPTKWNYCLKSRYGKEIFSANIIPVTDEEFEILSGKCVYLLEDNISCKAYRNKTGFEKCVYDGNLDLKISDKYKDDISLYKNSSLIFDLKKQRENVDKAIEELQNKIKGD